MAYIKLRKRDNTSTKLVRPHPEAKEFEVFGSRDGFLAFIHKHALDSIQQHAQRTGPKETIGLLCGRTCFDPNAGPYTLVMAAGDAREGEFISSAGDVRLLALGQIKVRRRLENAHPDREIVGWYHTHPTFDPRFSETDKQEQARATDPNYIGIVFSGINADEPFGVYRGPDAVLLKPIRQVEANTSVASRAVGVGSTSALLAGMSDDPFEQQVLTPRPEPRKSDELGGIVSSAVPPQRRMFRPQFVVAIVCSFLLLIQVLSFFWQKRRLSSIETRLQDLYARTSNFTERNSSQIPCSSDSRAGAVAVPSPAPSSTSEEPIFRVEDPELRPVVKASKPETKSRSKSRSQSKPKRTTGNSKPAPKS